MLPELIAEQVRQEVLYYLQSTFDFTREDEREAFERFLTAERTGVFKGPWIDVRLPFARAKSFENPFQFQAPFHPYTHQADAWRRLAGDNPESVLVTTGTGSGKTECFLYPILDYCLKARKQGLNGIKAIVLYPMNALAGDQERRFAKEIESIPELKESGIRLGIYIGRGEDTQRRGRTSMSAERGINDREALRKDPPDILLTNYRMLDFLLMRPDDRSLWQRNQPGELRFLVLDELHTYDGAQGTDVAVLIRRLKHRLSADHRLCAVGTSATLDSTTEKDSGRKVSASQGADAMATPEQRLADFATLLFGQKLETACVIGETRKSPAELTAPERVETARPESVSELLPDESETAIDYVTRQARLWGAPDRNSFEDSEDGEKQWQLALGDWLKQSETFWSLVVQASGGGNAVDRSDPPYPEAALADRWVKDQGWDVPPEQKTAVLASFLSIVHEAQAVDDPENPNGGRAVPLLPTTVHFWLREIRRIGRAVEESPRFVWLDEAEPDAPSLPAFHCKECGHSGWIAHRATYRDSEVQRKGGLMILDNDPKLVYRGWFGGEGEGRDSDLVVLSPRDPLAADEEDDVHYLFPRSLAIRANKNQCPVFGTPEAGIPIVFNDQSRYQVVQENDVPVGDQRCPHCLSAYGVMFIGCQSATMSALAVSELFGSRLNSDPKLLAFTDSVQDASHRAGFFSSRTYSFTFRSVLQRCIEEAGAEGLSPKSAPEALLKRMQSESKDKSLKNALASLLPPDLQEVDEWVKYRAAAESELDIAFADALNERLTWNVLEEFGFMQNHGRTLEWSGSSALGWDPKTIDETCDELLHLTRLKIDRSDALRWIYGLLYRYRTEGALHHVYVEPLATDSRWGRRPYRLRDGELRFYPPGGVYKPRLMATRPDEDHISFLSYTARAQQSWTQRWTWRCLKLANTLAIGDDHTDLLRDLLRAGLKSGLFRVVKESGNDGFYALDSGKTFLTAQCEALVCSETGRIIVRPRAEAQLLVGSPSLEYKADRGHYESLSEYDRRRRYYQERYRKGAIRRVVAEQHTGSLSPSDRESIEQRFHSPALADDPNVLACTSTLEMGIDIGDLSSTMLCSLPPGTANYLQRIGRAGRQTGAALIVAVVNNRPHDLFFYARPHDMIRGVVRPPGCWLDAASMLARQYLGFCFDRATAEVHWESIPGAVQQLLKDSEDPEGEFAQFYNFLKDQSDSLITAFLALFDNLTDETKRRFHEETRPEELVGRIAEAVRSLKDRLHSLTRTRRYLLSRLKEVDDPSDPLRRELESQLSGIDKQRNDLYRLNTLEHLTNEGLLPNYAFPERGVRFEGEIYSKAEEEREATFFTSIRPAGQAIRELAPGNTYYYRLRQFQIQRIFTGERKQPLFTDWHICGNCGYLASESKADDLPSACPQCGLPSNKKHALKEKEQKRKLLDFSRSAAISRMEYVESISGDRRDDRARTYFAMHTAFDGTLAEKREAFAEPDLPFGVDFMNAFVLRDLNAGYSSEAPTVTFQQGKTLPPGFLVCVGCGLVHPPGARKGLLHFQHAPDCPVRREMERKTGTFRHEWQNVFLYRELNSEAIRILLPALDTNERANLEACIRLGLRKEFQGSPGHIIVATQELPDAGGKYKQHFLVLMDGVPGGTGYLKALYERADDDGRLGKGVVDIMQNALNELRDCECKDPPPDASSEAEYLDPDGCYRCIRSYQQQYQAHQISRKGGIQLLSKLIEAARKRKAYGGMDDVPRERLIESALESRFLEWLKELIRSEQGTWIERPQAGADDFTLRDREWTLYRQMTLTKKDNVAEPVSADFVIRSSSSNALPVAVFLDGYEYHGKNIDRFKKDLRQREMIRGSERYRVCVLTWEDLADGNERNDLLMLDSKVATAVRTMAGRLGKAELKLPLIPGTGALMCQLLFPEEATNCAAFACAQAIEVARTDAFEPMPDWAASLPSAKAIQVSNDGRAPLTRWFLARGDNYPVGALALEDRGLENKNDEHEMLHESWRGFWQTYNIMQFLKGFIALAGSENLEDVVAAELTAEDQEWMKDLVEAAKPLARRLAVAGVVPEVGHEPQEEALDGYAAEMAWPEARVAVLFGSQIEALDAWRSAGWAVFEGANLTGAEIDSIRNQIAGK